MEDIQIKGKILACEWLYSESSNESNSFAVGYSNGSIEIFKTGDGKNNVPIKEVNFEINNLNQMTMAYHERGSPENALLSVFYSQKDSLKIDNNNENGTTSYVSLGEFENKMDDSLVFDRKKVFTSVIMFVGKKLD
jgi:hypothetical protein